MAGPRQASRARVTDCTGGACNRQNRPTGPAKAYRAPRRWYRSLAYGIRWWQCHYSPDPGGWPRPDVIHLSGAASGARRWSERGTPQRQSQVCACLLSPVTSGHEGIGGAASVRPVLSRRMLSLYPAVPRAYGLAYSGPRTPPSGEGMLGTRIDSAACSIGLAVFAYSSHIQRHERGSGTMGELSVWKKHLA